MSEADYRRALLLTRIEAQRSLLGLELRLARATIHPFGALLTFLGFDATIGGNVAAVLGRADGGLGALVPLLVAALLPLVERLRRPDPAGGDRPTAGPAEHA